MLEVRKNKFAKNYENIFFREFAKSLYESFKNKNWSGLLIGSPACKVDERLQIDALLITTNVVCIIDFKNFDGRIKLPDEKNFERGIWTNYNGIQIKGGNSINPFIQLKNQKSRFIEVYNKYIQKIMKATETFNPNKTVRIVCFQEEIELEGKIPLNQSLNFFIFDKMCFLEGILDIIDVYDKDISVSTESYFAFKEVFRAESFRFEDKPFEDKLKMFEDKTTIVDINKLYPEQYLALNEIKKFLECPDEQIFILLGTTNSGKSFLIPYIQEVAYSLGIQETEIFASSNRVAKNLLSLSCLENANSIYSYIYGGSKNNKQEVAYDDENKNNESNEEDIYLEELQIEEIPLKVCDNSDNALFIVDEAHLVSDTFNQSFDMIFGTGHLLKDFLGFTEPMNTKRKIIFIGDLFQLGVGTSSESPLNPIYLEKKYNLQSRAFELNDKPDFSPINKASLLCVKNIREKNYNSLDFEESDRICILPKGEIQRTISSMVNKKNECHLLCYSNEEAQKINYLIKESIIKNGKDIAVGDLVLINNNFSLEDLNDPFSVPTKISNGQFATIIEIKNNSIQKTIKIKKSQESIILTFRELEILIDDTKKQVKILSFENYRLNPKAQLSPNENNAYKILLNTLIAEHLKKYPFEESYEYSELITGVKYYSLEQEIMTLKMRVDNDEKVKTVLGEKIKEQKSLLKFAKKRYITNIKSVMSRDPSTEYYKFKNCAMLRFGWAMTVHKAMSYKWKEILFNVEKNNTMNENHFRWLYSGLSRAKEKVTLLNYKPISPFQKTDLLDRNTGIKTDEFYYIAFSKEKEKQLTEFEEYIFSKLITANIKIEKNEHLNWQERYYVRLNSETATISFNYNGKGMFRFPTFTEVSATFKKELASSLFLRNTIYDFNNIKDGWRKKYYEKLADQLKHKNIFFHQIIQTDFKDRIKLFDLENEEVELEVYYTINCEFSIITAKYYSKTTIWDLIVESILTIREG